MGKSALENYVTREAHAVASSIIALEIRERLYDGQGDGYNLFGKFRQSV